MPNITKPEAQGNARATRRQFVIALEERFPGWSPLMDMARDAQDESLEWEQRQRCREQVVDRLIPKLKSIDLELGAGEDLTAAIIAALSARSGR